MQKLGLALAATLALSAPAQAETLKMATIAPSLGAAISMATFANIVTKNVDGIEIKACPHANAQRLAQIVDFRVLPKLI